MHYNKDGTFLTKEEFKKIQKSFELKNEKKVQQKKMKVWGWMKLPDKIKHWKEVNGLISIPAGLRGFWLFEDKYPKINYINFPELNNQYKGNELDIRQDKAVENLLRADVGLLWASTGVGKAQPLDAKLLTDAGWIKMGDVKIGDKIFGGDGKLTNVVGVFPQGKKDIYEITFNDGTKAESCLEHLWTVQNYADRKRSSSGYISKLSGKPEHKLLRSKVYRTIELSEIKENLLAHKGKINERLNYSIDINQPIKFSKNKLEIHPYVLGVLIGDGSIVHAPNFSNSEADIINKVKRLLPKNHILSSFKDKRNENIDHRILNQSVSYNKITMGLKTLGLFGKRSYEKFIPEQYLYSSIEDRVELLRGLIDTDGYVLDNKRRRSQIEYTTTSVELSENIRFLVNSLGGRITIKKRNSGYKKDGVFIKCKDHYRCYIVLPKLTPVSSKKHLHRYEEPAQSKHRKYFKEIKFKRRELAQCIMVDNEDHLYITDNFIVTHNTACTAKIISKLQCKTLIVASGIELMNQMKNDLKELFGVTYKTLSGSKKKQKDVSEDIIIANVDTLVKQDKSFFDQFDLTILDEVDTYLGSDRRREMVWGKITTKYIYGLTGTVKINYIPDKIFDIYFGPKTELLEKHFQPHVYKVLTNFCHDPVVEMKKFTAFKKEIYADEERNNLIVKTVTETLGDKKGILFSEHVEHAKILKEKLEHKGIKCFFLIGEIKDKDRLEVKRQLKEHKGACLLIGSVKIIGRGFNVPELSVGYLTVAEKFTSNISQYVGRIIRKFTGKQKAIWYDFVDAGCSTLLNQSTTRTRTYKKEFPESKIEFYNG